METKTIETAQDALHVLAEWHERNAGNISYAILQWTRDAFEHDASATAQDVLRHLESLNCAGCHAPQGLIYNQDIADKVALWWDEIDAALADHYEQTGQNPQPKGRDAEGALTIGWLVWFAVEWVGYDAASFLSHKMEG